MEDLNNPVRPLQTDTDTRICILRRQPLFAQASDQTLKELANYFQDITFASGDTIVTEGEIVDCIFLIKEGHAEVSQKISKRKKTVIEVIAKLHPNEPIGLNDLGFFSATGVRTATVTASTLMHLLRLNLADFKQFLQTHPEFNLEKIALTFLHMNFIKQVEPFSAIDNGVLFQVAQNIQEVEVPPEEIIFKQGDEGDCCYLLHSGTIEITFTKADGTEKKITDLKPCTIFGELALLTEAKRNATAKTLAPSKLLILKKEDFLRLVQHNISAEPLVSLMMDRDRPQKNRSATLHERKAADGATLLILKNPQKGTYMQIPQEALLVWNLLDGEHTLQDIAIEFYREHGVLAIDEIGNLILRLINSGFVQTHNIKLYKQPQQLSWWMHIIFFIRKIMEFEIPFNNVDKSLTRAYQSFGYLFFTKSAKILMAILAIGGLIAFIYFFQHAAHILTITPHPWLFFIYLIPASAFIIIPHELAHAFTTKAYGRQVHRMGVGWFWTGPVAFTDTSDMWLSTYKPRMAVNIAGIYCNIVIAGVTAMLALFVSSPAIAIFLWLFSFLSYVLALYNLDPMIELDGYYLLMDFFDRPNLRAKAIRWLVEDGKKTFRDATLRRKYFPEICYWLSCIVFFFLLSFTTYLIATYILGSVLPSTIHGFHTEYLRWFLVLLVVVLSSLSVYGSIKQGFVKLK